MKKIRSYSSIWSVEKVIYAINDMRLPFPITFSQMAWFVACEFAVLALGGLPPLSMIDGALLKYFGADWFASSWNATSGAEILAVVMYVAIIGYFIWDSLRAKPEAE